MNKYYIEISNDCTSGYIIQSRWFDTEAEAIEWAKSLSFVEIGYSVWLMSSEWNVECDIPTNIIADKKLN